MMEVTKDMLSNRCIIESLGKIFLNLGNVSIQRPQNCALFFFFLIFNYLAAPGLSCSMQDL